MLSDKVISLAGHSFTIHYFWLYLAAAVFLFALIFFLWGYLRGKRVAGARSIPRDELSIYFGRMADSLERLQRVAGEISFNMTAESSRRETSREETSGTEYARQQADAPKRECATCGEGRERDASRFLINVRALSLFAPLAVERS